VSVFNYVNHSEIAEYMEITAKACYKVKYNTPERYKQAAINLLLDRVDFNELLKAVNFILELKGEPRILKQKKK